MLDINYYLFILSLITGLAFGYYYRIINRKLLIKLDKNMGKLVYEDKDNNCYRHVIENIKCPNSNILIDHPVIYGK